MPLPKRKKYERKKKFMNRCMRSDKMIKEYPKRKQRYAVCISQSNKK